MPTFGEKLMCDTLTLIPCCDVTGKDYHDYSGPENDYEAELMIFGNDEKGWEINCDYCTLSSNKQPTFVEAVLAWNKAVLEELQRRIDAEKEAVVLL